MNELVRGLAHLCSLRDRPALDDALVSLVLHTGRDHLASVRLLRLIGDLDDLRCLIRSERLAASAQCERPVPWVDWRDLPPLQQFELRQLARAKGGLVSAPLPAQSGSAPNPGGGWRYVLAVGRESPASNFLEMDATQPLSDELLDVISGVVALYSNFEGLLDYGEKDALTELLNRKTFDGAFAKAATQQQLAVEDLPSDRRAYHPDEAYWLAVVDIDHFKRVNDNYGHLIGDEVLLLMARLMRTSFRFHDQLYRFGGEEFVILMRCASESDAQAALERFRHHVQSYAFPQVGQITVSVGFDGLRGDDTPGQAFGRADKAVYHAKAHGRNQVVNYQTLLDAGQVAEESAPDNEIDFF